jgi:hypothetical protein
MSLQLEAEERAKRREAKDSHNLLRSTLDPLLARLSKVRWGRTLTRKLFAPQNT